MGVELASGSADLVSWLAGSGADQTLVCAIDRNIRRHSTFRTVGQRSHANVAGDVLELPIAREVVDLVVWRKLFCVLREPKAALKEILRILRPGGRMIAVEPAGRQQFYVPGDGRFGRLSLKLNEAFRQGWRQRGGDQDIGLRMAEFFIESGLDGVAIDAVVEAFLISDSRRSEKHVLEQLSTEASEFPVATKRLLRQGGLDEESLSEHRQLATQRLERYRNEGREADPDAASYVRVMSPLIVTHGIKSTS